MSVETRPNLTKTDFEHSKIFIFATRGFPTQLVISGTDLFVTRDVLIFFIFCELFEI